MAEIKIAGYFDCNYVQDSKVYEGEGLCPCLRAENHEVKIMEIKNSIDKTRQDKTRQDDYHSTRKDVKWWCLVIWIILSTTLLKVQTEFMTRIIYARQFRLVPAAEYSPKSLKRQNSV